MLRIWISLTTIFLLLNAPSQASIWDCFKVYSVQPKAESTSKRLSARIADIAYSIKRIRYQLDLQGLVKTYPRVLELADQTGLEIKDFRKYQGLKQIDEFFKQAAINLEAKNLGPINYLKTLGQGDKSILSEIEKLEKRISDRGAKVVWNAAEDQSVSNVSGNLISVLTTQAITIEPIPTVLSTINHELDHTIKEFTVTHDTDEKAFADLVTPTLIDDEIRVRLLQIQYDQHLIDAGILKSMDGTVNGLNAQIEKVLNQTGLTEKQRSLRIRGIVEADYYESTFNDVASYWMSEQAKIDTTLLREWMGQRSRDVRDAYHILRSSSRRQKIKSVKNRDEYDQTVISKATKEAGESEAFGRDLIQKIRNLSSKDVVPVKPKD